MKKFEKIALAALLVAAGSSTVTAVQVTRMVKNGFSIELTEKEQEDVQKTIEAMDVAMEDIKSEEIGEGE